MNFFEIMKENGYVEDDGSKNIYVFRKNGQASDIIMMFDILKKELDSFLVTKVLIKSNKEMVQLSIDKTNMEKDAQMFLEKSNYRRA